MKPVHKNLAASAILLLTFGSSSAYLASQNGNLKEELSLLVSGPSSKEPATKSRQFEPSARTLSDIRDEYPSSMSAKELLRRVTMAQHSNKQELLNLHNFFFGKLTIEELANLRNQLRDLDGNRSALSIIEHSIATFEFEHFRDRPEAFFDRIIEVATLNGSPLQHFTHWTIEHPDAAIAWFQSKLIQDASSTGSDHLLTRLLNAADPELISSSPFGPQDFWAEFIEQTKDIERALTLFESLDSPTKPGINLAKIIRYNEDLTFPEKASWLNEHLTDEKEHFEAISEILQAGPYDDPFLSQPNPSPEAEAWLKNQPADNFRDRLVSQKFTDNLSHQNFSEAYKLTHLISDPEQQKSAIMELAQPWLEASPEEAAANLPDAIIQKGEVLPR
jgi:hypothetical protein